MRQAARSPLRALALAALAAGAAACTTTYYVPRGEGRLGALAAVVQGRSGAALGRLAADMDPAMLALARRHDPYARRKDYWGRPAGWETYALARIPTLGLRSLTWEDARRINALKPAAPEAPEPAQPFVLKAGAADRTQALRCLTQAVYYEAARESLEGQQAVAQTVLNRLRHPEYPKSVCGVVYEGSQRMTGCQFSFTCDGSLMFAPEPGLWARAEGVARRALAGYVAKGVGTATHYHADYVAPYWAPTLYKIVQVGAHIFYRWTGPSGRAAAFVGRYRGGEANLSLDILQGFDARTQGDKLAPGVTVRPGRAGETVTLQVAGEVRTYAVADPAAPGDAPQLRVAGTLAPVRRAPTAEEVARINEKLAAIESDPDAPVSTAPRYGEPAPAFSDTLPIGTR